MSKLRASDILEKKLEEREEIKLNLGTQEFEGFTKASFPVLEFPWPIKDETVSEIVSPMNLNYTPAKYRGQFMDEIWRVLVPKGTAKVMVPYWTSMRSIQDYASEWPPFSESSFFYFNRDWRKLNHPDRNLICDFDSTFAYQADPETVGKNDETRSFWIKHYSNTVSDLIVLLTKRGSLKDLGERPEKSFKKKR
jgi:hypothetical protein